MAPTPVEKVFCVLEFEITWSAIVVQRRFWTNNSEDPSNRKSIYEWSRKFSTGSLSKWKSSGSAAVTVDHVQLVFYLLHLNPKKLTHKVSMGLQILHSTIVYPIMKIRLKIFPYKLHLFQSLTNVNKLKRSVLWVFARSAGRRRIFGETY